MEQEKLKSSLNIWYKEVIKKQVFYIAINFDEWVNYWNKIDNLENFFSKYFWEKNINIDDIKWTSYNNDNFNFHLNNWEIIQVSFWEFQNYIFNEIWFENKKEIRNTEKELKEVQSCIESIYTDNHWMIFNSEINDSDKVQSWKYSWKTLKEMKEVFDSLSKKLTEVYSITWETEKKLKILKSELKYYVWIWDKYESWGKYFEPNSKEIELKIREIVNNMSTKELLNYIVDCNRVISDNYKVSDMTKLSNTKFIKLLYSTTFDKLKQDENTTNKEFLDFAKIITWRWALNINKEWFNYNKLEIKDDENFNNPELANQVLTYLMIDRWVLKNNITDKLKKLKWKEIKIEDKELKWKSPSEIMISLEKELDGLNSKVSNYKYVEFRWVKLKWKKLKNEWEKVDRKIFKTWKEILIDLWLDKYIWTSKSYDEMDFEEKIAIWTASRILNFIENSTEEELQNPEFIKQKQHELIEDAIYDLNESISDNFNEKLLDWNWIDYKDLWLNWDIAEIFNLYQEINWNMWIFDFKDKNSWSPWAWSIVLWISIVAWCIILWPVIASWATLSWIALLWSWLLAWAKIGLISWITSNVFSHQWYDTYDEAIIDVGSQLTIDTVSSWLFTALWLPVIKFFWNINPDLLFSKEAWTTPSWLVDKWFIIWEVWTTWMALSPYIWSKVKQHFPENHFDPDEKVKK